MKLKIRNIILYPQDKDLKPRFLRFEEDKINIITGYSQRGKSAIIAIIDYCLGSEHCNIPIGLIRRKVDKFAIYITLESEKIFIARDCPSGSKETEIMYFHLLEKGENPSFNNNSWIEDSEKYKVNRNYVKNFLGTRAGFENISEKDENSLSGFDAPSSFRDTAAFLFQPQNIIANPTTIFYKTDSFDHLQRLKVLFPLALGYKSFEILKLEKEILKLEKESSEKERKLEQIRSQYENWQSDIYEYYSKAISMGVTNADIDIESSKVNQIKAELQKIVLKVKDRNIFQSGSSLRYSDKLEELENRRNSLLRNLDKLKVDLSKIERFDSSKNKYIKETAHEINERLKPIDWFLMQKGTNVCPFCNSETSKAINELLSLKSIQERNKIILVESNSNDFSFEDEKYKLRNDISEKEKLLKQIDSNIEILIDENKEYYQKYQKVFEFSGKIENVLENLEKIEPSGELAQEIERINSQIAKRKVIVLKLKEKFDKESALNNVTKAIDTYIKLLPIEDRNNKIVHLDPEKSASIKVEDINTKDFTFLSRIGSGANHMCYHLSTLLGLHEYFLKLTESGKNNFVPSFLVFDQPSQVYFPEGFPDENDKINKASKKVSLDIQSTGEIFKTCSIFMERTNFKTQIIILEHAPESTWKNVKYINVVEEWRGFLDDDESDFNALIKKDWLP